MANKHANDISDKVYQKLYASVGYFNSQFCCILDFMHVIYRHRTVPSNDVELGALTVPARCVHVQTTVGIDKATKDCWVSNDRLWIDSSC